MLPGVLNRALGYQALQLGEGHDAAPECHGADNPGCRRGGGDLSHQDALRRDALRQSRSGDERRCAATQAVENSHQLGHGRHLNFGGQRRPDHGSQNQADQDQLEAQDAMIHQGDQNGDQHAGSPHQIAPNGRPGMG